MHKNRTEQRRKRLIKLIHVARRELRMADDTYRLMLANIPALGGKTSSADLSVDGLEIVLKAMKAKGFKVRKTPKSRTDKNSRPLADDDQSKLIRHLWLRLHALGAVRDPSERAMSQFVCKMVKIEALQWLDINQASAVIENLKEWRKRRLWELLRDQWAALHDLGAVSGIQPVEAYVMTRVASTENSSPRSIVAQKLAFVLEELHNWRREIEDGRGATTEVP